MPEIIFMSTMKYFLLLNRNGIVCLHINLLGLFNAKDILVEEK